MKWHDARPAPLRARHDQDMLHQEWNVGVDEAIEMEAQAQAVCMQTDFRRAYEAFAAKKNPSSKATDDGSSTTAGRSSRTPSPVGLTRRVGSERT